MEPILKKFNISEFINRADKVLDKEIQDLLKSRIKDIKKLGLDVANAYKIPSHKEEIERLKKKIDLSRKNGYNELFSLYECFLMSLYISEFSDNKELSLFIVGVLRKNWNELFINYLCCFVLNHWRDLETSDRYQPIYNLFYEKISTYKGLSARYKNWRDNIQYFKQKENCVSGPAKLGLEAKEENLPLIDIPEKLGFPKTFFHDEFYQETILNYYANITAIPDDIEDVLDSHNNKDTNKLVISRFIRDAYGSGEAKTGLIRQRVFLQNLALDKVGHPSEPGKWDLVDYNDADRKLVKEAASILNHWLIEQYIEEIFTKFINDPKRKKFWLKYAKENAIDSVQIVGQIEVKERLEMIASIKESLKYCFILTKRRMQGQCAFIIRIRECYFIEFSDLGSVYVYRDDKHIQWFKSFNNEYGVSIKYLKNTELTNGVKSDSDFKISHYSNGAWAFELSEFIKGL